MCDCDALWRCVLKFCHLFFFVHTFCLLVITVTYFKIIKLRLMMINTNKALRLSATQWNSLCHCRPSSSSLLIVMPFYPSFAAGVRFQWNSLQTDTADKRARLGVLLRMPYLSVCLVYKTVVVAPHVQWFLFLFCVTLFACVCGRHWPVNKKH